MEARRGGNMETSLFTPQQLKPNLSLVFMRKQNGDLTSVGHKPAHVLEVRPCCSRSYRIVCSISQLASMKIWGPRSLTVKQIQNYWNLLTQPQSYMHENEESFQGSRHQDVSKLSQIMGRQYLKGANRVSMAAFCQLTWKLYLKSECLPLNNYAFVSLPHLGDGVMLWQRHLTTSTSGQVTTCVITPRPVCTFRCFASSYSHMAGDDPPFPLLLHVFK